MIKMRRLVVTLLVCVSWMPLSPVFGAGGADRSAETGGQPGGVYVEAGSWPDSLAATRDRYRADNSVMAVSDWYLHGGKYASRTIDASFAPETSHVNLDAKGKMSGWKVIRRTQNGKPMRCLSPGTVTYVYREFLCTSDGVGLETEFAVTAGHLAVWHNGKKIFSEESKNPRAPMQKTVALRFTKGKNRLLVKMAGARGAHMTFSPAGTSMKQLKMELMKHGGDKAYLLCETGYFRKHEQWLFARNGGGLLKDATSALMSSIRGFSTLEREFAALSGADPDKNASAWIGFYTRLAALSTPISQNGGQYQAAFFFGRPAMILATDFVDQLNGWACSFH